MKLHSTNMQDPQSVDESEVRGLYRQLLECWNMGNTDAYAILFQGDGNLIVFDGSQNNAWI